MLSGVRERATRVVTLSPAVLQTALAAALAWWLSRTVLGHDVPFVAPVTAIAVLGITYGQNVQRAVESALGVALGILVADVIVIALGGGPLVIALVIVLAMTAAIALGAGRAVVSQAAVSAAIVATIEVPDSFTPDRAFDALVGGGVALALNLLVFPLDPERLARRALTPLLDELAAVLDEVAAGLHGADHDLAVDALARARGLDQRALDFAEAARIGDEIARQAPLRRRRRVALQRYARLATFLDLAVRNTRVLARGAVRAVDTGAHVPDEDVAAVRDLATAVRAMGQPGSRDAAREHALRAAGEATLGLERTSNLSATHLVAQVRATAVDLLRALGVEGDAARDAVRRAAADRASSGA